MPAESPHSEENRPAKTPVGLPGGGGRFSLGNLVVLLTLLIAPGLAIWRRVMPELAPWLAGWFALISLGVFLLYSWDKRRAQRGEWRVSETNLHLGEFLGGWPGAFVAQRVLRHKSSKWSFRFVYWTIVILHQYVAIDWLLHWPVFIFVREGLRGSLAS